MSDENRDDAAVQERATAAQQQLRRAIATSCREDAVELREAYGLIDDLLAMLYGGTSAWQQATEDAPRSLEAPPEEIQRINVVAAGKIFLLQQRINRMEALVRQATEFTYDPDLSGIADRRFLNPADWVVRIGRGTGSRWYLWRGNPRNPDVTPVYAFYDGSRFVPDSRVSYLERVHLGTDDFEMQKNHLDNALADQVRYAENAAMSVAERKPRTYPH